MKKLDKATFVGGYGALTLLAFSGAIGLALFVPAISGGLAATYSEFANDQAVIAALLSAPVIAAELIIAEIMYLLWLVHKDRMFSARVYKWVQLLVATTLGLAGSFVAIQVWLSQKGTLPPFYLFALVILTLISIAVALVTRSLLGLLRKATSATEDLEGVI